MDGHVYGPVNDVVQSARLLSGLDGCTVAWLLVLVFIVKEIWRMRKEYKHQEEWQKIRNAQITEHVATTEVMRQVVTELAAVKMVVSQIAFKE